MHINNSNEIIHENAALFTMRLIQLIGMMLSWKPSVSKLIYVLSMAYLQFMRSSPLPNFSIYAKGFEICKTNYLAALCRV